MELIYKLLKECVIHLLPTGIQSKFTSWTHLNFNKEPDDIDIASGDSYRIQELQTGKWWKKRIINSKTFQAHMPNISHEYCLSCLAIAAMALKIYRLSAEKLGLARPSCLVKIHQKSVYFMHLISEGRTILCRLMRRWDYYIQLKKR